MFSNDQEKLLAIDQVNNLRIFKGLNVEYRAEVALVSDFIHETLCSPSDADIAGLLHSFAAIIILYYYYFFLKKNNPKYININI